MNITPESVQQLLNSEDLGDRLKALNQARQLEPAVAFQLLQPAITDKSSRVRYAAVSQMCTLGTQDLSTALKVLRERLLTDSEVDVQAAAADALGALRLSEAFEDLQQVYYTTSEWIIKLSIVATIGEMQEPRAFSLLENALTADNELIQTVAISAFGELGDPKAVELLLPFITHPDWQIRYRVVQALTRLGGTQAQAALSILVHDQVEQVAGEAKKALSN